MNTVCPGFMPHHVKPNRCRRCFKDLQDHNASNEVSSVFTLTLPRRRRESVAVVEKPDAPSPSSSVDQSASFVITETTSLGRRTRPRSSSSSSWFQERKVNDDQKEAIDSRLRSSREAPDDDRELETVAVIRLPDLGRRRARDGDDASTDRRGEDASAVVTLPRQRTATSTTDASKTSTSEKTASKDSASTSGAGKSSKRDAPSGADKTLPKDSTARAGKSSASSKSDDPSSRANDADGRPPALPPKSADKLDMVKKFEPPKRRDADDKAADSKTPSKLERRESLTSSLKARFEAASDSKDSTTESKKFGESKLSDVRSRASKFDVTATKAQPSNANDSSRFPIKPSDLKQKQASRSTESSADDTLAKKTDDKPKSVLSRFPSFRGTESPPAKPPVSKPKPPSPSSSEEESSEVPEELSSKPKELAKSTRTFPIKEPEKKPTAAGAQKEPEKKTGWSAPDKKAANLSSLKETEKKASNPAQTTEPEKNAGVSTTHKEPEKKSSHLTTKEPEKKVTADTKEPERKWGASNLGSSRWKPKGDAEKETKVETDSQANQKLIKDQENTIRDLRGSLDQLRRQLEGSEERVRQLERERGELRERQQLQLDKDRESLERTAQELARMRAKLDEMQNSQEEVKTENKKLKQELDSNKKELKDKTKELKDSKQELNRAKQELSKKESRPGLELLKQKLAQSEALCQELMEENEEIKKEVRDLEQELEELHDNFREDQASEFRGLKKELEAANKNCRVLQFKLRKAEKRCELLELDRHGLEDKLREYQATVRQDVDRSRLKELEKELSAARAASKSLSNEVDDLKEALLRLETENEALRQQTTGGGRSLTPTSQSRLSPALKDGGKDYEALSHELYDTMERENDLREQLKFSEEEARQSRRKVVALEQENETLVLQIKKLTSVVRKRTGSRQGVDEEDEEEEEELSADNLKLQLDLQEQEMGVLRRKLDESDRENEALQSEVKYLQEKVINQPLIELPELPKEASSPGAYWEHRNRLMEFEVREARKKVVEKDREIGRLQTEVEIYRKKASKMMVRSRSLDSDLQVDLKRQLQLVEQEAGMLRQKVNTLESENEKLCVENKRMTLRLSKKPPLSSLDQLQLENMELRQRLEEQQSKLEALREELEKATAGDQVLIQPRRPSLTLASDSEADLIASLKRRLRARDEEAQALQARAAQLDVENGRLARDLKKLKDALGTRKRPAKALRDSATRAELKEMVGELQDEISELQVSLRSREVIQEGLEEELERTKRELKDALSELKHHEGKLQLEVDKSKSEKEALMKEVDAQKSRATAAEAQLSQASAQGAGAAEQSRRLAEVSAERAEAERRARAAEEQLEAKTQRLREAQEKLNAAAALREDLARANRMLEAQKADLEKEVDEHRSLLAKAEARATELRSQVEKTDRDLTSLRKECNQLRNELEDERGRLRGAGESSPAGSWAREREDLRRQSNELRNRIEQLQRQLTDSEKQAIEKESRLREDFKRKKEAAVKEAREKGESALELAKEEERILRGKAQELSDKLEKLEASLREAGEKARKAASEHRREKEDWQAERERLQAEARSEVKRREKSERECEQQLRLKDEEVLRSKERLVAVEREQRRLQVQLEELEEQRQKAQLLEKEADRMRDDYDHLTARYEQLEADLVATKSKLVQEKEQAESQLGELRKEREELAYQLNSLKEAHSSKQEAWTKEKQDLLERAKELARRLERLKGAEQERRRLLSELEEKQALVEALRKEEKRLKEEKEALRKMVEAAGRPGAEGQEWEGRASLMCAEMGSMQAQIGALAAERDALRAQLSSAERSAEDLRTGSLKRERARHREEADAARRKVQELRYQLEDLREQLDDAQLENRNLRLQLETDKNAFEIEMAELRSKNNQLEEQKILETARGQTRNIARTRLELTWEKERAELQLRLAESQRLVGELRARLERAEAEREKERGAARRQLLDLRAATEKDRQESRRKMSELHSSLLEIREAHAKLRGLYDRMRKEREDWRPRLQAAQQLHAKVAEIAADVDKISSEVVGNSEKKTLTISPSFAATIQKVKEKLLELQTAADASKEDERLKRSASFRRALSAQDMSAGGPPGDPLSRWDHPQRVTSYPVAPPSMVIRPPPRTKTLQRKSRSLDHALSGAGLKIWAESEAESVGSTPAGSTLSLGGYGYETDSSLPDSEYRYGGVTQHRRYYGGLTTDSEAGVSSREASVDPGGSTESVPVASTQKRSFRDKLKLLRRTKSIDVSTGRKLGEDPRLEKEAREQSLRSKISRVLRKPLGRAVDPSPALPPRGIVPDVVPNRPTAEKPLSASRGSLSNQRPASAQGRTRTSAQRPGAETPV